MRTRTRRWSGGYHRHEWLYALVITLAALMVPLCLTVMLWLLPSTQAADNWQVDGAHGVLHVRGELTESACRLEMASAYQAVSLGNTATAQLAQAGDRGVPVNVQLHLRDCLRTASNNRDVRTGNLVWSPQQPAVSVSFIAPADADNPALVKVRGAAGLGLRIADEHGKDVRLGSRGAPLALAVGQQALNYTVTPERTRAPLLPGAYAAVVDFQLSYD
ncbi:type 1 fimbrial protein [Serratia marcescens]|uniref:fimbrial protein n=1 Tax=Serratia marcescens TaxID=615 RepID=UPI001409500E|nr:fimbrial protein [Serratia marcescens]EGS9994243.1 type 1 fimbrial protein [Serratia marcescens]MBH2985427.1 type 1 fimbrial protein [Serratia marcescens]MBH3072578.1 type 1 fimbrial protein [Serratia marcescens]QIO26460.1 type 1 fimbrial protein [Serratia marcescens]HEJ0331722.1 type 1 fimbrial protein [Serratia marcescens]